VQVIPREVQVFVLPDGKSPFDEWIEGLKDRTGRAKIQTRLDRVAEGNLGDHGAVGEGVSELRIDFGPGYRVYYAETGPTIVLLLIGGDKSTQQKDIKVAKEYWRSFKEGENEQPHSQL
jgi:putative addiction module killer protein